MQLDRPKIKSVRDFYGEDEAVYIMDAKTTGNIGRYLNVNIYKFSLEFSSSNIEHYIIFPAFL